MGFYSGHLISKNLDEHPKSNTEYGKRVMGVGVPSLEKWLMVLDDDMKILDGKKTRKWTVAVQLRAKRLIKNASYAPNDETQKNARKCPFGINMFSVYRIF